MGFVDHGHLPPESLETAVQAALAWLRDGSRVYIHCRAGWQRSAAVAAGVVALTQECELAEALEVVRARKPSANPMPQQREGLERWWEARDEAGAAGATRRPGDDEP